MTTAQLEHLRLIDAHLDKLLETAGNRTLGDWETKTGGELLRNINSGDQVVCTVAMRRGAGNLPFIASCAGNAEAGWRSVKITAEWLIFMHDHGEGWRNVGLLDDLLAAWPLELITKHQ